MKYKNKPLINFKCVNFYFYIFTEQLNIFDKITIKYYQITIKNSFEMGYM